MRFLINFILSFFLQRKTHQRESFTGVRYDKLGDHEQAKMPQESQRSKKGGRKTKQTDERELNAENYEAMFEGGDDEEEEENENEETRFITPSKNQQHFYYTSSERT